MANHLKMDKVFTILTLHKAGWSDRQIARELGIHRETVGRRIRLASAGSKKPASNPPAGSGGQMETPDGGARCPLGRTFYIDRPQSTGPQEPELPPCCPNSVSCPWTGAWSAGSKPASNLPAGSEAAGELPSGPASACEPYREAILSKLQQGLTAQRIYQDLVGDGFANAYDSVKRYVRKLDKKEELPFRRMECAPGAEAQVDFGTGAPIVSGEGHRQRTHVLRIVLSHSRKGYSESVFRQRPSRADHQGGQQPAADAPGGGGLGGDPMESVDAGDL